MSTELEEVQMRIVVALDVHRRQIRYKTLDRGSGEVRRGRIVPATRGAVREWLEQFAGCEAEFTGGDGAKTDSADCDLQLKLLLAGELPESWIPPAHLLELRTRVRMRKVSISAPPGSSGCRRSSSTRVCRPG